MAQRVDRPAKLMILFLAANPEGTERGDLDKQVREIEAKIRASEYRDVLELMSAWAVRPDDLIQQLLEHKPHIVHFTGHGTLTEEIILEGSDGQPKAVSKEALVELFRTLKDNLQVVLLIACFSEPQARAIAEVVDCAVGMNSAVEVNAAMIFAASFYRALGFGRSVKEAVDLGSAALRLEGIAPEEARPRLVARAGVDPATVFPCGA